MTDAIRVVIRGQGVWMSCLLGLALGPSGLVGAETLPLLTNAIQVIQLSLDQAALHYPVQVRGVVTYADRIGKYGFVQDKTAGAVFFWTNATRPIEAGQFVQVDGSINPNLYSPVIASPVFQVLGQGQFPQPLKATFNVLHAGHADCQWTEVEGMVRSATTNSDFLFLWVAIEGHRFKVSILLERALDPEPWVQTRIRVRGVACGSFNAKGQFVGAELLVPSLDHIEILESSHSDPYLMPLTSVSVLGHKSEKPPSQRIHIQGVVTLFLPEKALYVYDQTNSIEVRTTQPAGIKPGDRVDVIGFYEKTDNALVIEDGNFRWLAKGTMPAPIAVTVDQLSRGRFDAELVTLPARLLEWRHGPSEQTLSLQASNVIFTVRLGGGKYQELPLGSLVQVTGVCVVTADRNQNILSFELFLRSPADLVLLERSAWWTPRRILWAIGVLLVIGVFVLGWVGVLARANNQLEQRVAERTEALERENTERKRAEEALRESQALYHSLVEHLPVSIYRKDAEGHYLFVNPRFCQFQGSNASQILGRTVFDLFPLKEAEQYAREDETVIRSGKLVERDNEYHAVDGSIRHFHTLKTPVLNAAGKAVGTQGMLTDITERKRAETELAYERDLLGALLDYSPDYIYFKDLDSRFIKCSKAQVKRFGLESMQEIVGKTDFDFFAEEHARPAFEDEQEIIHTGRPIAGKIEKESWPGGSKVTWVLTSKLPLLDKAGQVMGTFGISKDINDIKEAEAKLEKVHHQLLETSRKAGMAEVASSVLHNVGNVLNSVNVSATLVAEGLRKSKTASLGKLAVLLKEHSGDLVRFLIEDEKGRQIPAFVGQLADHMENERQRLIREVEVLSKNITHIKEIVAMQQSHARVSGLVETLSVETLLEDALQMNSEAYARHGIRVIRQYAKTLPVEVDKHKALQILINLVGNAKSALVSSTASERVLTVGVSLNGNNRIRVTIQDNGVGISRENLTRIFSHGFTTHHDGHGFGLHSGALAAREMGGSLSVHSDGPGKGSIFTLELPLHPSEHSAPPEPSA